MPRPPRHLPDAEVERLALVRAEATAKRAELLGTYDPSDDILAAIATAWVVDREGPEFDALVGLALDHPHRRIWREIAAACGLDQRDEAVVHNLGQAWRRRQPR